MEEEEEEDLLVSGPYTDSYFRREMVLLIKSARSRKLLGGKEAFCVHFLGGQRTL